MSKIPNIIKFSVTLLFIDLILILNHLRKPYFVFGGIIFIESIVATIIILLLSTMIIYFGYKVLKQNKSIYFVSRYFFLFLVINSVINLIASFFLTNDMAGFLYGVFGESVLFGYVIIQILIIIVNLSLYWLLYASKDILQ
jgi:hypothetical protein